MSPDLIARRTTMAAMLYYGLDQPFITDAEFDAGCKLLIKRWDELEPIRKWQLGSPEELATTGYHIKITMAGVCAACDWAGLGFQVVPNAPWRMNKKFGTRWLPAGMFHAGETFEHPFPKQAHPGFHPDFPRA